MGECDRLSGENTWLNQFYQPIVQIKRRQPSSTLKLIRKFTLYRVSITAISCKWALEYSNDIFISFTSLKVSIASHTCLNAVLLQYRKEKNISLSSEIWIKLFVSRYCCCCYTINKYKGFYHDFKWSAWCKRFSWGWISFVRNCSICYLLTTWSERC